MLKVNLNFYNKIANFWLRYVKPWVKYDFSDGPRVFRGDQGCPTSQLPRQWRQIAKGSKIKCFLDVQFLDVLLFTLALWWAKASESKEENNNVCLAWSEDPLNKISSRSDKVWAAEILVSLLTQSKMAEDPMTETDKWYFEVHVVQRIQLYPRCKCRSEISELSPYCSMGCHNNDKTKKKSMNHRGYIHSFMLGT